MVDDLDSHEQMLERRRFAHEPGSLGARLGLQRMYPALFTVCPDCCGSGCLVCDRTGRVTLATAKQRGAA